MWESEDKDSTDRFASKESKAGPFSRKLLNYITMVSLFSYISGAGKKAAAAS
jgi:hypothetical protein